VANYNVDIAVALKGAEKLTRFNKQVETTETKINKFNQRLKDLSKNQNLYVKSFDNLNRVLSKAKNNFNAAASGSNLQKKAAQQLIAAEKELNKEYMQRENLLNSLRRKEQGKEFTQNIRSQGFKKNLIEQSDGSFLNKRRQELLLINRASTLEDRINKTLAKRGKMLSANGKQIISNNQARSGGLRTQSFRQKASGAIGSGIIGGGFPLLFGQGPTAAVGGALGGVAGGLVGGQFGFALSIAGTAIGSALDDLANALAKPTENIESLITKLGIAETPTAKLALRLEKLGLKSSAATLLLEKFEEKFGLTTGEIEENTKKMTDFKNKINELGTQITLFLSNSLTPFLEKITAATKARNKEDNIISLQKQLREQIIATGGDKKSFDIQNQMIKKSAQRRRKEENLSFGEYQDVLANMYRNLLGFDMTKFKPNQNNITNNNFNNNLPNNNLPDPKLKDLEKLADDTFNLQNIVPLQQAFEIEKNRFKLTSAELNLQKEKNTLTLLNKELTLKTKENQLITTDSLKDEIAILDQKSKNQELIVKNAERLVNIDKLKNQASLADLDNRIKLQKESLTLLPKELNILQQKSKLSSLESALDIAKAENNQSKVNNLLKQIELQNILIEQAEILANPIQAEMIMLDQQMKQLNDVGMRVVGLSQTIGSSFQESFKGVIMGTMSVTDAFRNMTNRIADYFLDMAAKMMANQLQKSILGMFGGMFGGGMMGGGGYFDLMTGKGTAGPNFGLADGGTARAGRTYMVGERGPELFSPGITGTVTPNHALGGSTNVTVNVDASGSSVEGDANQAEQLGTVISQAIQAELVQQRRPGGILYN